MSMKQILFALLRLAAQEPAPAPPKPKRRRKLSQRRKPCAGARRLDQSRPLFQQIRNLQRGRQ
jgi:hypothetical protein